MKHLLALLFVALLALPGCAQAGKAVVPTEATTPVPRVARVEIYRDAAREFRWRLVAKNHWIIADSAEGYATVANAFRAVETVRRTLPAARTVDIGLPRTWRQQPPNGPDTTRKVDARGNPNFGPRPR